MKDVIQADRNAAADLADALGYDTNDVAGIRSGVFDGDLKSNEGKILCAIVARRLSASNELVEAWQDIASAPTENGSYLVWCPERRNTYIVVYRDNEALGEPGWFHFGGIGWSRLLEGPTHWRPLPAPPVSA
jgi:hypothetical protein